MKPQSCSTYLLCRECDYERYSNKFPSDGPLTCPECGSIDAWDEHFYDYKLDFDSKGKTEAEIEEYEKRAAV